MTLFAWHHEIVTTSNLEIRVMTECLEMFLIVTAASVLPTGTPWVGIRDAAKTTTVSRTVYHSQGSLAPNY